MKFFHSISPDALDKPVFLLFLSTPHYFSSLQAYPGRFALSVWNDQHNVRVERVPHNHFDKIEIAELFYHRGTTYSTTRSISFYRYSPQWVSTRWIVVLYCYSRRRIWWCGSRYVDESEYAVSEDEFSAYLSYTRVCLFCLVGWRCSEVSCHFGSLINSTKSIQTCIESSARSAMSCGIVMSVGIVHLASSQSFATIVHSARENRWNLIARLVRVTPKCWEERMRDLHISFLGYASRQPSIPSLSFSFRICRLWVIAFAVRLVHCSLLSCFSRVAGLVSPAILLADR